LREWVTTRRFGGEASVKRAAIRESQRHTYVNNHKQSLRRLSLAPSWSHWRRSKNLRRAKRKSLRWQTLRTIRMT